MRDQRSKLLKQRLISVVSLGPNIPLLAQVKEPNIIDIETQVSQELDVIVSLAQKGTMPE
jgi:hypothetical protein